MLAKYCMFAVKYLSLSSAPVAIYLAWRPPDLVVKLLIPNASIDWSWLITYLLAPLTPRLSTVNLGVLGGAWTASPLIVNVLPEE